MYPIYCKEECSKMHTLDQEYNPHVDFSHQIHEATPNKIQYTSVHWNENALQLDLKSPLNTGEEFQAFWQIHTEADGLWLWMPF